MNCSVSVIGKVNTSDFEHLSYRVVFEDNDYWLGASLYLTGEGMGLHFASRLRFGVLQGVE